MRLASATAAFVALLILATVLGASHEPFEGGGAPTETNLDRLCRIVEVINVDNQDVSDLCAEHRRAGGRDFCVKGCDPVSLCGFPAIDQCSTGSKRCDVTHEFVGPHISSYNDHLPRFFLVKHAFCVRLEVGVAMRWFVRVDPALVNVMLAFPKSIMLPHVDDAFHDLAGYWSLDTAEEKQTIMFAEDPGRPSFLWGSGLKASPPVPVKNPAFAIYETSASVDGERTWRETTGDEFDEMVERDMNERRPASPDKMVFTFFKRFEESGETASNGFHEYQLRNGVLETCLLPEITVGSAPVSLLVSAVVDMKGGGVVLEVREAVYYAGVYKITRKILQTPPPFRTNNVFQGFRYFLGSIDPESCKKLLLGTAVNSTQA